MKRKDDPQIKVQGTIAPNSRGGEIVVFSIPLGPMEIVCLVNIPAEGDTKAPVYVKFKFVGDRNELREPQRYFRRNSDEQEFDDENTSANHALDVG